MLKIPVVFLLILALLLGTAQPSLGQGYPILSSEEFFCEAGTHPTRYENFGKSCKYDSWAWLPGERQPRPISEEEMCAKLHRYPKILKDENGKEQEYWGKGLCSRTKRRASCKGSETYPGTVLCSSLELCPDLDGDGFPCCEPGEVVVSSRHHNMTPDKQDCPLPGSPEHRFCNDNDAGIHPGSPVRIDDFTHIEVGAGNLDRSEYGFDDRDREILGMTPLPPAEQIGITPLTPLDVLVYARYCAQPAPSFSATVELVAPNNKLLGSWHNRSFQLVPSTERNEPARYQTTLNDPDSYEMEELINTIADGGVPHLRFTTDGQHYYVQPVPMTNCHVWYGSLRQSGGKGVAALVQTHTDDGLTFEEEIGFHRELLGFSLMHLASTTPFSRYLDQIPFVSDLKPQKAAGEYSLYRKTGSCPKSLTFLKIVSPDLVSTRQILKEGQVVGGMALPSRCVVNYRSPDLGRTIMHELTHAVTALKVKDEYVYDIHLAGRSIFNLLSQRSANCSMADNIPRKWGYQGRLLSQNSFRGCSTNGFFRSSRMSLMNKGDGSPESHLLNIPSCAGVLSYLKGGHYRKHLQECAEFPDSEIVKQ